MIDYTAIPETYRYLYDDFGSIVGLADKTGEEVVTYEYNAVGNRTKKIATFTYVPQGNPATMTKNGVTYYYHVNGHGDVVALTDRNGNIVAQYSYDAWGNILSQTGSMASDNPLRYAGYRYDEVTGLYYLMARYYDAEIGRFITRDTFHGFEDETQSLNQYAYCANNPVIYVDPSGHYWRNGWWNSTTTVGRVLDAIIILISAGQTIYGYYAAKAFLRKNKHKVLYRIKGKILAMFGRPVAAGLSGALNIALTLVGSSVGQLIAKALDYADPWWGKRRNNGYVFG